MVEEVAKLMHLLFCEFIFFKSSLNNLIILFTIISLISGNMLTFAFFRCASISSTYLGKSVVVVRKL